VNKMDTISIKRLFLIADLVLIALAVYMGVKGIYGVVTSRLDTLPPATTSSNRSVSIKQTDLPPYSDYRGIVQRNLFQTVTESETAGESDVLDNLEETELKLKLWSTFASDNPAMSFAIIEDESKRDGQKVYKIDDTVQNATVRRILEDKVVLSVASRDEVLQLQKRSGGTSTSTRVATSAVAATSSTTSSVQTTRISLRREQVESALENLSDLATQVTVEYQNKDGVEGLALSNIKANSLFRRMGLRNGDVLVAVEGEPLTNTSQALQLYEKLKSADSASVEINRRGRSRVIQYNIR